MNPPAPVTRTLRPLQSRWSDRADGTEAIYSVMRMLVCVPWYAPARGTLPATRERGRALPKRAFLAIWGRRTVREAAACLYLSDTERGEYLAAGADPARLHPMPPPLDLPEPGEVPRAAVPTIVYL